MKGLYIRTIDEGSNNKSTIAETIERDNAIRDIEDIKAEGGGHIDICIYRLNGAIVFQTKAKAYGKCFLIRGKFEPTKCANI